MIAILSIAMLCGFGMLENFGTNPDRMLKITGTTTGKIMVQNSRNNLTDEIWKIDGVTEILTYQNLEPEISKGNKTMSANTFAMIDPEKKNDSVRKMADVFLPYEGLSRSNGELARIQSYAESFLAGEKSSSEVSRLVYLITLN
jgi:hypothetical protein